MLVATVALQTVVTVWFLFKTKAGAGADLLTAAPSAGIAAAQAPWAPPSSCLLCETDGEPEPAVLWDPAPFEPVHK